MSSHMTRSAIDELLLSQRVVVCCGSGGVGKTTTSAALALRAATLGRSAIVITIDPAKRLATSLGLQALSATATDLTGTVNSARRADGMPSLEGRFFAIMPDTAQTFETFVKNVAGKNTSLAQRILKTSIYKIFAKEYSGTNEYMAMEKLYQLYHEKEYDLIVLDTPPAANTKSFLEAPRLLADFFDDRIMKWVIAPGSKLVAGALQKLMEILERLTGQGFISELIEFTSALFELRSSFMENLEAVGRLLHQSDVSFLMVTSPERLSKSDTQEFVAILKERGYRFWGFMVNRVLGKRLGIADADYRRSRLETWAQEFADAETASILRENFSKLEGLLEHEREARDFLSRLSGPGAHIALVSEQPTDVHSIKSLAAISDQLSTAH